MVYGPFNVLLDLVCKFLLRTLTSVSISGIGLYLSLGIRVVIATQNEFGSVPYSVNFWKTFKRIDINPSLNV